MTVMTALLFTGLLSAQAIDPVDRILAEIRQLVAAQQYDDAMQKTLILRDAIEVRKPKPVSELDEWTHWPNLSTPQKLFAILDKFNVKIKLLADRCARVTTTAELKKIEADWAMTQRLCLKALKFI